MEENPYKSPQTGDAGTSVMRFIFSSSAGSRAVVAFLGVSLLITSVSQFMLIESAARFAENNGIRVHRDCFDFGCGLGGL